MSIGRRTLWTAAAAAVVLSQALAQAPPVNGQAPPANGQLDGPSTRFQRRAAPPARIMEFKADRTSIQPGQSIMLEWATENPSGVTLEPGVGRVTPRGSRQLSPKETTTYTLTVRGPNNTEVTRTLTVNVAGTKAVADNDATTNAENRPVPRMPDGKPDLSGVYNFSMGFPGGRGRGRGRGGPPPAPDPNAPVLKPGAEKYKIVRGPDDEGQYADCMPVAPPQAYSVPYQWQIVQGLNYVTIFYEYPGTFRIIPTSGGPHQADLDPTWMGDSIGHWEGDTLVVDIAGFNDKTEVNGFKHTEALHVVERFHRTSFNQLQYEATIEDPNVWVKPWTLTRTFQLRPDLTKIGEFVCENNHENQYEKFFKK
jgi:hypothetical protein